MNRPLLITMGDAAGIGPEIIARAFRDSPADMSGCVVVGDVTTMRRAAALLAAPLALPVAHLESLAEAPSVPPHCIAVLQKCELPAPVPYGQVSSLAGQAGADCIVWAARAVLAGEAAAMVTAPIHKEALAAAGGWSDTVLPLPGGGTAWTDVITGESVESGTPRVADLLRRYPVALLLKEDQ